MKGTVAIFCAAPASDLQRRPCWMWPLVCQWLQQPGLPVLHHCGAAASASRAVTVSFLMLPPGLVKLFFQESTFITHSESGRRPAFKLARARRPPQWVTQLPARGCPGPCHEWL